jgi:hypothetical protein
MKPIQRFLVGCLLVGISSCAGLNRGGNQVEPAMVVQLKVNSLQAKSVQEKGVLGSQDGDELTLVYALQAYDERGALVAVNTGYWGTRTIAEGSMIPAAEFDKISVRVPKDGKVLAALALLEIDDYKGERRIAQVKSRTRVERQPSFMQATSFNEDQHLAPLELITKALAVAGYRNFMSKHLTVSTNDDLGGTKKVMETTDLSRIMSGGRAGQETVELDGSQVNENYFYVLKYDLDVTPPSKAQ